MCYNYTYIITLLIIISSFVLFLMLKTKKRVENIEDN